MFQCIAVIGSVPNKDMQTPPLSFDLTFMKDAKCGEINVSFQYIALKQSFQRKHSFQHVAETFVY